MSASQPMPLPRFKAASSFKTVHFCEHFSPHYTGRTALNAKGADLTVACAADYSTAGERLTERLAEERGKERYLRLPLYLEPEEAAERLAERMLEINAQSLNIAGNGVYTLEEKGWSQARMDAWMAKTLELARQRAPIAFILSGGQTGADFSGAVAAALLGVPGVITLPKGFIQRGPKGFDAPQRPEDLAERLRLACEALSPEPNPPAPPKM